MANKSRRARIDAAVVVGVGIVVAAAPAVWYRLVWPDMPDHSGLAGFLLVFIPSVIPFVLIAPFRAEEHVGRVATTVALLAAGSFVVLGQWAGLDPTDPSSTASVALVTVPM